jgi:hypothetical protein
MHGKEITDRPLVSYPSCTIISPNSNIGTLSTSCGMPDPEYVLQLIKRYREIYLKYATVAEANQSIVPYMLDQAYKPSYLSMMMDYNIFPYEFEKLRAVNSSFKPQTKTDILRLRQHDNLYGLIPGDNARHSVGIYVISVSHTDIEMGGDYSRLLSPFASFSRPSLPTEYNNLQSYNLINVRNLETIFGKPYVLGTEVVDYIGIQQCYRFTTSDILNMFLELGFEHVNIINMSCRFVPVEKMLSDSSQLIQQNHSEIAGYTDFITKNPHWGGRTRKTRRNKRRRKKQFKTKVTKQNYYCNK